MVASINPAQEGHAGLSSAATRDAGRLVDQLARTLGHGAAVAWVHAGAVLQWAAGTGLFPTAVASAATATGISDAIKMLADAHPALADFTSTAAVPLWEQPITDGDAAAICDLWSTHPVQDTPQRPHGYLLGNAYQALSEESRKNRALCQTPRFISDLLLDLAFDPAAAEFGLRGLRMIDPSCGTGHILIESAIRAWAWTPGGRSGVRALASRGPEGLRTAMGIVHGVDLDPYAALIARLRLVVLASSILRANREHWAGGMVFMPGDWPVNVTAADSLLDRNEPLLERGWYHVVVGNPPYITPKTDVQRDAVRAAYPQVCNGKYALSLPFHQLMTDLLVPGGWCSQLTANSFMKREFGKRFVEEYLVRQDLRWVIDTSGAYIPGHGTPTVILAHRNRAPIGDTVSAVLGIKGEPSAPSDPSQGIVWREIARLVSEKLAFQRLAAALGQQQPTPVAVPHPIVEQRVTEQLALFADWLTDAA